MKMTNYFKVWVREEGKLVHFLYPFNKDSAANIERLVLQRHSLGTGRISVWAPYRHYPVIGQGLLDAAS